MILLLFKFLNFLILPYFTEVFSYTLKNKNNYLPTEKKYFLQVPIKFDFQ